MAQRLNRLKETASQTAGPYVHIGLTPNVCDISGVYPEDLGNRMVNDKTTGERVTLELRVFDGTGSPVKDALIEVWQADSRGLYDSPLETRGTADPDFAGWGRFAADMESGVFRFDTVKPGSVPFADGTPQAPHIGLWIVARGINIGLHTRLYFDDEEAANARDPVLSRIEHRDRVRTLIAARAGDVYRHDIRLQGDGETVFFDV